jgi:protein-disulfide isomerase-like protein with CxxC motif
MEQVHKSRWFLWKLIFRSDNKAEKEYIATLKEQVQNLSNMGYPTHKVNEKLAAKLLDQSIAKANDDLLYRKRHQQKPAKDEKRTEEQALENKIVLVSEKLNETLEDTTFQQEYSRTLGEALPEGGFGVAKMGMFESSMSSLAATLKDTNEVYDSKRASGASEQESMQFYVKQVFYKTFEMTDMLGYYQLKDRVLAAQNMTDLIMRDLSPVSMAKDSLAMYAEGYILKNPELIMEGLAQDSGLPQESLEKAFDGAKKEYDRMPININEANNVMDMGKAPQVHQAPQISARTMKN